MDKIDKEKKKRIEKSLIEKARSNPSLLKLFKSDKAMDTFFRAIDEVEPSVTNTIIEAVINYRKNTEKESYPIKVTFECEDMEKLKRLSKVDDMACFIWELVHNGWRKWKHSDDYNYEPAWERIHELLDEFGICIDDLTY